MNRFEVINLDIGVERRRCMITAIARFTEVGRVVDKKRYYKFYTDEDTGATE